MSAAMIGATRSVNAIPAATPLLPQRRSTQPYSGRRYIATTTPRKPAMITVFTIQRNSTSTITNSTLVTIIRRSSGTVSSVRRVLVRRSRRRRSRLSTTGSAMDDLRGAEVVRQEGCPLNHSPPPVHIRLDNPNYLGGSGAHHIPQHDVTLRQRLVEPNLSELMASGAVDPGELTFVEQPIACVLGMHGHHWTALGVALFGCLKGADAKGTVESRVVHGVRSAECGVRSAECGVRSAE